MNTSRYVSKKLSEKACEGERIGAEGFPIKWEETPVFELMHSNGRGLPICEYHIEFYWNAWPPFCDAVRDIWPVQKVAGQRS
jgi:hypothetical protein